MEKFELDKKAQLQKMKEGHIQDNDVFELESTRTLVHQYQLNLASYKSFLKVQDMMDRASIQSNRMQSSIHNFNNFRGRNLLQSSMQIREENNSPNNSQHSLEKSKIKNKSLFMSSFNFRPHHQ